MQDNPSKQNQGQYAKEVYYIQVAAAALFVVAVINTVIHLVVGTPYYPIIGVLACVGSLPALHKPLIEAYPRYFKIHLILVIYLALLAVATLSGGLKSSSLSWLLTLAGISFFILSQRFAFIIGLLCLAVLPGFYFFESLDLMPKNILTEKQLMVQSIGDRLIGIIFAMAVFSKISNYITNIKSDLSDLTSIQQNLLSIFDEADDFIGMADDNGNIVYHNRAFNDITGKNPEKVSSLKIPDFHPPWAVDVVVKKGIPNAMKKGSWTGETAIYNADNQEIPVLQTIIPHKDRDKNITHISTIMKDIRILKERERKLEEAKTHSENAAKTKSQFLANMSHEIRTPMNGILGMTTLMKDEVNNPGLLRMLETIERSGDSLLRILDSILDFSKMEAGKLELEAIEFNTHELFEDIKSIMLSRAYERHITIELNIDPTTPKALISDPNRLRQVVTNLLSNAIKFSKNSTIKINIKTVPCKEQNTSRVECSISDKGIGISKSKQKKLFKPFSQVDTSNTRQFGGTGLGLSISKAIVETAGGKIWVESIEGKGSTFFFTWNFIVAESIEPKPAKSYNFVDYELTILVVEDNSVNRDIINGFLEGSGYNPDFAYNGQDALEKVSQKKYDLIFMDCQMPVMDGYEATKQIILKYGNTRPLIYALTASAMKEDRDKCKAAGMDGFLSKPIRKKELQLTLNTIKNQLYLQRRSS